MGAEHVPRKHRCIEILTLIYQTTEIP